MFQHFKDNLFLRYWRGGGRPGAPVQPVHWLHTWGLRHGEVRYNPFHSNLPCLYI